MKLGKFKNLNQSVISLVLILVGLFILKILLRYSGQVANSIYLLSWQSCLISFVLYSLYFYCRSIAWHFIMSALKHPLTLKNSISTWFIGESARYIPGNIWSFASRVFLAAQFNIPKSITLLSLTIESLVMITLTFFLSLPALSSSDRLIKINYLLLVIVLIALLCVIGSFLLRNKLHRIVGKLEHLPKEIFYSTNFLFAVSIQLIGWLSFGVATYLLIQALSPNLNPLAFISTSILVWLIGYLSFITPMGLGVREAAFILLLSPVMDVGKATLVSVISRVIMILAEVLNIIIWLFISRRQVLIRGVGMITKRWDLISLWVIVLTYISVFSTLSILRHDAFASSFDLANMDQTIWNSLHGRFFEMTTNLSNASRLETHADFILVLLSPLYLLWDNVRILLIFQSIIIGLGAIPVFLLANKLLDNRLTAIILSLIYLLNPGLQWANIYDFHAVTLSMTFLISGFYFALTKKWRLYWLFFVLSLLSKEEISLVLAIIGFFTWLFFRNWKVGIVSMLIGLVWFPLMIFWAIPHAGTGNDWAFNSWFSAPKGDLDQHNYQALLNLIRSDLTFPYAINYYQLLLKPFGFLPVLGIPWLLLVLPDLIINILSTNPAMQTITLHYSSGIIPGLIISTIFGLVYLEWGAKKILQLCRLTRFSSLSKSLPLTVSLLVLILAARFSYHYGPTPLSPSCWCLVYQVDQADLDFNRVLSQIPETSSITASSQVRPHLTHRQDAYNLPSIPQGVDYIAISDQNRSVGDYQPQEFEVSLILKLNKGSSYRQVFHEEHFYLYQRVGF